MQSPYTDPSLRLFENLCGCVVFRRSDQQCRRSTGGVLQWFCLYEELGCARVLSHCTPQSRRMREVISATDYRLLKSSTEFWIGHISRLMTQFYSSPIDFKDLTSAYIDINMDVFRQIGWLGMPRWPSFCGSMQFLHFAVKWRLRWLLLFIERP